MSEFSEKLNQLQTRLEHLEKYESAFKREIADIRRNIDLLKSGSQPIKFKTSEQTYQKHAEQKIFPKTDPSSHGKTPDSEYKQTRSSKPDSASIPFAQKTAKDALAGQARSNLEKFIGEDLISKIGIVVLIIGVGIGTKYAIDNNLISPLLRIVFGYFAGFVLIGFAIKLKAKYHDYSAVLMSGGMAIMYFITYFAYSYYALLSQISAFSLMVIFTIFTVIVSIAYNRQIIAHIGLVGAYAVPLLLSENSGRFEVLFTYIAIINAGILAISVKKYWKPLFFTSFALTWAIYAAWYFDTPDPYIYPAAALLFLTIFFLIFYLTFLAFKVVQNETFKIENAALILLNSFIFYGFGYSIIDRPTLEEFLGLWTILNAGIHFLFAFSLYKFKLGDKTAFYLILALVLTFLTIAIPIQTKGDWLTLLWMAEAVFLFVIGRIKNIRLFECFSYPLMMLACLSLLLIWQNAMDTYYVETKNAPYPILNGDFVTSLSAAFGFIVIYFFELKKRVGSEAEVLLDPIARYAIPSVLLIILYNTFRVEIGNYFQYVELVTAAQTTNEFTGHFYLIRDEMLKYFSFIWQLNYTMFFLSCLSFINIQKLKSTALGFVNLALNSITLAVFSFVGLVVFSFLNSDYLHYTPVELFKPTIYFVMIRYISFAFVVLLIFGCYRYIRQEFLTKFVPAGYLRIIFDVGAHVLLLVVLSSELINWSDYFGFTDIFKLGLTILFGFYAVFLIVLGIIYKKLHLRIFAIAVLALTLCKLFFYDLAELDTISKTIVFISVGILLLITSFLYTKYKNVIFEDESI